jgi:hypothetical protein
LRLAGECALDQRGHIGDQQLGPATKYAVLPTNIRVHLLRIALDRRGPDQTVLWGDEAARIAVVASRAASAADPAQRRREGGMGQGRAARPHPTRSKRC